MKSVLQVLLTVFIMIGMSSLVPFVVYGEDFTFEELLEQAKQGDADAQHNLGYMYRYGEGVAQDINEGIKWHRMAAEQGHSVAQYLLGWMYQNGNGVAMDGKEAVKWFNKAAEQEHTQAQFNLGWMYDQGEGVSQDYVTAYAWYNLAALQKHDAAKYNRDFILAKMSSSQIEEGKKFSKELYDKIYHRTN